MTSRRTEVISEVAEELLARQSDHPLRVGVDGVCGSGKSVFARELAAEVSALGHTAVRIDSDGFHYPRARRYRQGRESARGYYEDAYDLEAVADKVLRPLGPGGALEYAVRVHDLDSDAVLDEVAVAPADAIVIFDATFIQRGDLRDLWDEVIYLDAVERTALRRGVARDAATLGGELAARASYETRYMAACRIYLAEQDPIGRASFVIDNTDLIEPVIARLPERRSNEG